MNANEDAHRFWARAGFPFPIIRTASLGLKEGGTIDEVSLA